MVPAWCQNQNKDRPSPHENTKRPLGTQFCHPGMGWGAAMASGGHWQGHGKAQWGDPGLTQPGPEMWPGDPQSRQATLRLSAGDSWKQQLSLRVYP